MAFFSFLHFGLVCWFMLPHNIVVWFCAEFTGTSTVLLLILTVGYYCHYTAGADLHVHEGATVDVRWLIKHATYDPHCFMCTSHSSGALDFHFFETPPPLTDSSGLLYSLFLVHTCPIF